VVLAHCRTSDEWSALTTVGHHRYGPLSYEAHVFYGLRPWVRDMCRELLTSE
jgi:hypothetical protein